MLNEKVFIEIDIDSGKEEEKEKNLERKTKKKLIKKSLSFPTNSSKFKEKEKEEDKSSILINSLAAAISNNDEKEDDDYIEDEEEEEEEIISNNNELRRKRLQSTPITSSSSLSIIKLKNEKIIDSLLGQIYNSSFNSSFNNTSSYLISDSDLFLNNRTSIIEDYNQERNKFIFNLKKKSNSKFLKQTISFYSIFLLFQDKNELEDLVSTLNFKCQQISTKIIRYLRLKDKLTSKVKRNEELLTAILQAVSLKRSIFPYLFSLSSFKISQLK